jgi:hypothetical protein
MAASRRVLSSTGMSVSAVTFSASWSRRKPSCRRTWACSGGGNRRSARWKARRASPGRWRRRSRRMPANDCPLLRRAQHLAVNGLRRVGHGLPFTSPLGTRPAPRPDCYPTATPPSSRPGGGPRRRRAVMRGVGLRPSPPAANGLRRPNPRIRLSTDRTADDGSGSSPAARGGCRVWGGRAWREARSWRSRTAT